MNAGPRPFLLLLLLAPALALFALLTVYPLVRLLLLSFAATDHGFADATWVGLDNYAELAAPASKAAPRWLSTA